MVLQISSITGHLSPSDLHLLFSTCYHTSAFFPHDTMLLHYIRFNTFLWAMVVGSCLVFSYTLYVWTPGSARKIENHMLKVCAVVALDSSCVWEKYHTRNLSCLPSCQGSSHLAVDILQGQLTLIVTLPSSCQPHLLIHVSGHLWDNKYHLYLYSDL